MSQPISVSITMDAASFHKFRSFDLFRHQKRWRRPLAFTAILLVFSCICLSQVGVREGAALLAVVLAVVALGLPAVGFYTFFRALRTPIKKLGLPAPSTASGSMTPALPSGWRASRTARSPATSTRGRTSTSPTAPPMPFTSMSSRPKPTS